MAKTSEKNSQSKDKGASKTASKTAPKSDKGSASKSTKTKRNANQCAAFFYGGKLVKGGKVFFFSVDSDDVEKYFSENLAQYFGKSSGTIKYCKCEDSSDVLTKVLKSVKDHVLEEDSQWITISTKEALEQLKKAADQKTSKAIKFGKNEEGDDDDDEGNKKPTSKGKSAASKKDSSKAKQAASKGGKPAAKSSGKAASKKEASDASDASDAAEASDADDSDADDSDAEEAVENVDNDADDSGEESEADKPVQKKGAASKSSGKDSKPKGKGK
jgi:hypothetical protein